MQTQEVHAKLHTDSNARTGDAGAAREQHNPLHHHAASLSLQFYNYLCPIISLVC